MKSFVERDKKRRTLHAKYEKKRLVLKTIIKNRLLTTRTRLLAGFYLDKLPKNSSYVRVHNRCIITGRSRGIYRRFRLSRIKVRDFINNRMIPGLIKASW